MADNTATLDALHRRVDMHHEDLITLKVQHTHLGAQLDRLDSFLRDHMAAEEAGMREIRGELTSLNTQLNRMKNMYFGAITVASAGVPLILFLSKTGVL